MGVLRMKRYEVFDVRFYNFTVKSFMLAPMKIKGPESHQTSATLPGATTERYVMPWKIGVVTYGSDGTPEKFGPNPGVKPTPLNLLPALDIIPLTPSFDGVQYPKDGSPPLVAAARVLRVRYFGNAIPVEADGKNYLKIPLNRQAKSGGGLEPETSILIPYQKLFETVNGVNQLSKNAELAMTKALVTLAVKEKDKASGHPQAPPNLTGLFVEPLLPSSTTPQITPGPTPPRSPTEGIVNFTGDQQPGTTPLMTPGPSSRR
jgi:hypothetical protein